MVKGFWPESDRRQWGRALYSLSCSVRVVSGKDRTVVSSHQKGIVENISQGGLLIRVRSTDMDGLHISGQLTETGWASNKVEVEFDLPTVPPERVRFLGFTEWYEREPGLGSIRVGLSMRHLEMVEADMERLKRFTAS